MMNVVYAVTHDYYEKIFPSVASLLTHNYNVKLFLLGEDDEVHFPFDITVVNVKNNHTFDNSPNYNTYYKYVNLMKVIYPTLLPVDKVIHLDADTIVLDSLEEMWNMDLDGKWFGAVQEKLGKYHPFGPKYYNMGIAVINLKQMRLDKAEEKLIRYLHLNEQPWADQDAWNKEGLDADKIVDIPLRFNENVMTGETDNPAIIHYCANPNWWDDKVGHRSEYLVHYKDLCKYWKSK